MLSRKVKNFFWFVLLSCFFSVAQAQPDVALIPSPPQIAAKSYVLMDATSGDIIIENNAHEVLPPASLTKMMTAYIVEYEIARGNIKATDDVLVSVNAWRTGGSKMFIKEGTRVPLAELLKGVIIQSGNDASIALAEHIAGGEGAFADIMNQHATLLGMKNTHFRNATGLPADDHKTTAFDLAILARAIIRDFPEQYAIYSEKYFTYNNIRQPNRNLLLWRDKSVDGLKTGHTDEAGYCLVSSAKRDDMRLISVVLGTRSEEARAKETQKLLNYGFRYYETHKLYDAGQSLMDAPVWLGTQDQVALGAARDVIVTIPRGQKEKLQATLDVESVIKAPFSAGQEFGRLKVTLADQTVVDRPLVALQDVEEGGFFKRLWDLIKLFFINLFS
ncbi:MAG: D-alanyl-D-alanine carboxypeptidase [Hahellaceae bacterium]|nr:D-alanyl-D-alanine carboxypeptidase [Hahellaceae bacterium]MCP5169900.1 D-alanyl-D-alanine carboxypeptidase [Hahellaceae bacterium]